MHRWTIEESFEQTDTLSQHYPQKVVGLHSRAAKRPCGTIVVRCRAIRQRTGQDRTADRGQDKIEDRTGDRTEDRTGNRTRDGTEDMTG